MEIWFTADNHWKHSKVLLYQNRPFGSVDEMDETMIKRWNERVGKKDMIYHLGDFCFGNDHEYFYRLLNRLNGKIVLIKGNHDKLSWRFREKFYLSFDTHHEMMIGQQKITLSHYPLLSWRSKGRGAICCHGHSHYNLKVTQKEGIMVGKIFDVGVDGNNFFPYSFEEIMKIMENKPTVPTFDGFQDHHDKTN